MTDNLLKKFYESGPQLAPSFDRAMKDWQLAVDWKNDDEEDGVLKCRLANLESDSYNLRKLIEMVDDYLVSQPSPTEIDHLHQRINQLEDCLKDNGIEFPEDDFSY